MNQTDNTDNVLELASEAGHILLQNGAEISRVEDTMARIAAHYGVETGNFFVLSHHIGRIKETAHGKARYVEKSDASIALLLQSISPVGSPITVNAPPQLAARTIAEP